MDKSKDKYYKFIISDLMSKTVFITTPSLNLIKTPILRSWLGVNELWYITPPFREETILYFSNSYNEFPDDVKKHVTITYGTNEDEVETIVMMYRNKILELIANG